MAGDGRALVVGYRGARGCKLSLIVLPGAEGSETGLTPIAAQDVAGFVWRAGRLGYAILAQGMAEARLRVIVNKVMEASRRRLPLDKAPRGPGWPRAAPRARPAVSEAFGEKSDPPVVSPIRQDPPGPRDRSVPGE